MVELSELGRSELRAGQCSQEVGLGPVGRPQLHGAQLKGAPVVRRADRRLHGDIAAARTAASKVVDDGEGVGGRYADEEVDLVLNERLQDFV